MFSQLMPGAGALPREITEGRLEHDMAFWGVSSWRQGQLVRRDGIWLWKAYVTLFVSG